MLQTYHIWPLLCWGSLLLCTPQTFLKSFNHKWLMNFVKGFFCTYLDDHMVFIFQFVNMVYQIDFYILKNPCIPGINPTWSWCMSFLICCWILFTKILLRFLHLCSSVILACSFLFIVLSLSGFCIRVMMALWPCRMSLEMFLPLLFFEIILEGIGISSSLNTTQILNTHRSTNIWR